MICNVDKPPISKEVFDVISLEDSFIKMSEGWLNQTKNLNQCNAQILAIREWADYIKSLREKEDNNAK